MANNILKMSNAGGMSSVTRYIDMLAGNEAYSPSSYESIATVTVGAGGSSSVSFSSIPSTYKHLQIRAIGKPSTSQDWLCARLNGATSGYSFHALYGSGASAGAEGGASVSYARMMLADPSQFGGFIIDILDYADTNKYKTLRSLWGYDNNGSGYVGINSSVYQSTSATTSVTLLNASGNNFVQYSSFALYGVKG